MTLRERIERVAKQKPTYTGGISTDDARRVLALLGAAKTAKEDIRKGDYHCALGALSCGIAAFEEAP